MSIFKQGAEIEYRGSFYLVYARTPEGVLYLMEKGEWDVEKYSLTIHESYFGDRVVEVTQQAEELYELYAKKVKPGNRKRSVEYIRKHLVKGKSYMEMRDIIDKYAIKVTNVERKYKKNPENFFSIINGQV
jgi:hypothetical protein